MGNSERVSEFAGLPVVDWEPGTPLVNASGTAYRVSLSWDEIYRFDLRPTVSRLAAFFGLRRRREEPVPTGRTWADKFAALLEDPAVAQVPGLIIGPWGEAMSEGSGAIVETLV